jgi:Phage integrase family
MAKLRPPKVTDKPVPFFSSVELTKLGRCCRGNSFEDRRDAAVLAVLLATGIRVSELAAIRYCPDDRGRGDVNLEAREMRVRDKGGRERTVRISHEAARRLDRYLRVRSGHELAYRPELWLGAGSRCPLDRSGIYQLVVRRGQECGVRLHPHRFRHQDLCCFCVLARKTRFAGTFQQAATAERPPVNAATGEHPAPAATPRAGRRPPPASPLRFARNRATTQRNLVRDQPQAKQGQIADSDRLGAGRMTQCK